MNNDTCPKCGYPNIINEKGGVTHYLGMYKPGWKCGYCNHIEVVEKKKEPRQIIAINIEGDSLYFAWEDTHEPLSYDEMRDIEVVYNQALIKQFADELE